MKVQPLEVGQKDGGFDVPLSLIFGAYGISIVCCFDFSTLLVPDCFCGGSSFEYVESRCHSDLLHWLAMMFKSS